MGKVNRNNQTLRSKFITSFHFVLFKSIVATILTWIVLIFSITMLFSTNKLNPANYYEKKLPTIEKYIDAAGASILSSNSQNLFESVIPLDGMDYQVMDLDGQIVYGTYQAKLVSNEEELKRNIATRSAKKMAVLLNSIRLKMIKEYCKGLLFLSMALACSLQIHIING